MPPAKDVAAHPHPPACYPFCTLPHCFCQSFPSRPNIEPESFRDVRLIYVEGLTKICQSQRSMERVHICENPLMEAWYTNSGQSLLGDKFCSDLVYTRSFDESMFQTILHNERVILIGNPSSRKSV